MMADEPDEIVLNHAYVFTCNNCGHKQFGELVEAELHPDEQEALNRIAGIEPDSYESKVLSDAGMNEGVSMVMTPSRVTCEKCETTFGVWVDPDTVVNRDEL